MQKLIGSVLAIGVACVAAIAATTAMLNTPHRIGAAAVNSANVTPAEDPAAPASTPPAVPETGKPASPGATPDAAKPATSAGAAAPGTDTKKEDEGGDKDPYEGIAPEELPPDLQYNADSSVSFPTNI
ncbi:MAG: hypothetical protein ABI821_12235 [Pseudomonadota bacterium]